MRDADHQHQHRDDERKVRLPAGWNAYHYLRGEWDPERPEEEVVEREEPEPEPLEELERGSERGAVYERGSERGAV